MKTKTMVRLDDEDGPRYLRTRLRDKIAGVIGVGTPPDPDVFPRRADETDVDVGFRLLNRLTSGDWVDEEFLTVARDWAVSIRDALLARDWAALGAPEHTVEHLTANDGTLATGVEEAVAVIDDLLDAVRADRTRYVAAKHRAAGSPSVHFGPWDTVDAAYDWLNERGFTAQIIPVAPPTSDTSPGAPVWG